MQLSREHGCRLGCIILLIASCSCFQLTIPARVAAPMRSISKLHEPRWGSKHKPWQLTLLYPTAINMSRNSTEYAASSGSTGNLANGDSLGRNYYPMGITKHYFETMEEQSGKDYRWIKPLKKPVSQLMM